MNRANFPNFTLDFIEQYFVFTKGFALSNYTNLYFRQIIKYIWIAYVNFSHWRIENKYLKITPIFHFDEY